VHSKAKSGLSLTHNVQVITIYNYLCCMGVLCKWLKLKHICRFWAG